MKQPKKKLKPSWEIVSRILWDPKLNKENFFVGYLDRVANEIREKEIQNWADSDVPWNRVQHVRCADTIVWDRNERLDLFEENQLPKEAYLEINRPIPAKNKFENFVERRVYKELNGDWGINILTEKNTTSNIKIVSYNVLSNKFDADLIYSKERIPASLKILKNLQADIILLQEVDAPMLEALKQVDWLKNWYSSERNLIGDSYFQQQLILSKFAFTLIEHQYSKEKKFPIASFDFKGTLLHVANVHFTSNRSPKAEEFRLKQIQELLRYLHSLQGDVMIAGDFNIREETDMNLFEGFQDAWSELKPNDLGYTFNPKENKLAKLMSIKGEPARFDRFLIKQNRNWEAKAIEIFGKESLKGNEEKFISDHYGLLLKLESEKKEVVFLKNEKWDWIKPVYQSGVVIIPPKKLWPKIQAIRNKFDVKVSRWMPHITLLYGFVPDRHFKEAAKDISALVKDLEAFEINLKDYRFFSHNSSVTAWLNPVVAEAEFFRKLQSDLQQLFPMSNGKLKKLDEFKPHLTIGQFASELEAKSVLPEWKELNFSAGKIALISRQKDEAFEIRYTVELGTGEIELLGENRMEDQRIIALVEKIKMPLLVADREKRAFVLELLEEACSDVLNQIIKLELLGSSRLGTATKSSDLDLICSIPSSIEPLQFLEQLEQECYGITEKSRLVKDALIPVLKLNLMGLEVDLQAAKDPKFPLGLNQLKENDCLSFEAQSWKAASGILESENLLAIVRKCCSENSFEVFVKTILAWAGINELKGNANGYLGSYSWTVLVLWVCQQIPDKEDRESLPVFLEYFFKLLAEHSWTSPIYLQKSIPNYKKKKKESISILTTVHPCFNSARNCTTSTAETLHLAFVKGLEIVNGIKNKKAEWEDLFQNLIPDFETSIVLKMQAESEVLLEEYLGWLNSKLVVLMLDLEQNTKAELRVYPIQKKDLSASQKIGIKFEESQKEKIGMCFQNFIMSFDQAMDNFNPYAFDWDWKKDDSK